MKKNINIILLSCLFSILAIRCSDDTEMIFDETASERKTEAVDKYLTEIKSAEQGWVFQYFPSEELEYGGYNFIVKFNEEDMVSVWTELSSDLTYSESSFYDVIPYGGPVLTFNTYNLFMHYFATPSSSEYEAKGGDYEFLFMSSSADTLFVKGVKTSNNMRLIKLNESPEVYLNKVLENESYIASGTLVGSVGEVEIGITNSSRNLTLSYTENAESVSVVAPYIITDKGITLYEPIDILGNTVKDFVLDKENSRLVAGNVIFNIITPPIDINAHTWYLEMTNAETSCQAIYDAYVQAYTDNATRWGESLLNTAIIGEVSATYGDYGISFYSVVDEDSQYRAHYNLDFKGVYGHEDYIDIVKVGDGFNWSWYTQLEPIVNVIADNSPYSIEVNDAENPTLVKLTSVNDSEVSFVIYQP